MSDVQFEDRQYKQAMPVGRPATGLIGMLIKNGIVKDESGANMVLIGIAVVAIILTLIVIL